MTQLYIGNFSIRFCEKTTNFQLEMGPFTGPACNEYFALLFLIEFWNQPPFLETLGILIHIPVLDISIVYEGR